LSWLPTIKIGFWNAWILILYVPLLSPIMKAVDKVVGTSKIFTKMGGDVSYQKGEKQAYNIYMVVFYTILVYSIFLPLKLGTAWFYSGITIYLFGLVVLVTAIVNVAKTPLGKPFTQGMYRYSRHPEYFSLSITFVGVGIASASWFFLLLSVLCIILQISSVTAEERACLEIYGGEYQDYLNITPKWIGIPKSR
jgi:protein-S-isoprenylcysteine O-methyltransferase Ste14